ncbi:MULTISPECIES: copper homeostasis membrane protein CopD [unclassified Sphingobium]|uniref:copper homeostasis membrane protein CopD n=1 Tax=unclassified Sphingobium TaxID=2611147 RepID=UPI0035A7007F
MGEGALIAARFALMMDLALLLGLPLFWWVMGRAGRGAAAAWLALGGLLLSAFWLVASTAAMTGTSVLAPDWASVAVLLTMTPIGPVLAVRACALLLALLLALAGRLRLAIVPSALAVATLAWTGHAGATEGLAGTLHRAADIAHVWAASAWIGALAALLHAALRLRQGHDPRPVAAMLARFALMGTLVVATLVVSGAVNLILITGLVEMTKLPGSRYGWLLAAKLLLFALMLGLAAANRWRLTPALERGGDGALRHLRWSLLVETSAAVAIIGLVAWLGTLDPMA